MDLFRCGSSECQQDAIYQCLEDHECVCSQHLKKCHARHKFKPIPAEEALQRRALFALICADLQRLTEDGLVQFLRTALDSHIRTAADDFRTVFEDWIAVHRQQLQLVSAVSAQGKIWTDGYRAVFRRLGTRFDDPLIACSVKQVPVYVSGSSSSAAPVRVETEDIVSQFLAAMQSLSTTAFFQDNRHRLLPSLTQLWESQSWQQISLKSVHSEPDLMALSLLLARSLVTRSVIITRSGFNKTNCRWLSEALKRTKSEVRTLDISGNALGDEGLEELFAGIRAVRTISLLAIRCTGVTDASMPLLKSVPRVRLDATGNRFSPEAKESLHIQNPDNKV